MLKRSAFAVCILLFAYGSVCLISSCASGPGTNNNGPNATTTATNQPADAPGETTFSTLAPAQLNGIIITRFNVFPLSTNNALQMSLAPSVLSAVRLHIIPLDGRSDSGSMDVTVNPNTDGTVTLQNLQGLVSETPYRLELTAMAANQPVGARQNFSIPEPDGHSEGFGWPDEEGTARRPALFRGSRIGGELELGTGATAVEIRTADAQGTALFSKKLTVDSLHDNVLHFPFSFDLSPETERLLARSTYRVFYASGVSSPWKRGPDFAKLTGKTLSGLQPVADRPCLSSHPLFRWQEVQGASYRVFISVNKPDSPQLASDVHIIESPVNWMLVDLKKLFPTLREDTLIYWKVELSDKTIASEWISFRYMTALDDLLTIVPQGNQAHFIIGLEKGPPDESPSHAVVLTKPLSMLRSAISNTLFVELMNRRITRGVAIISGTNIVDKFSGHVLVGTGDLGYGQQFGLRLTQQGLLEPIPGKENHPVIGVTWFGALAICREATEILGADKGFWRLPREAEWEYAAEGGGLGPSPWGVALQASTGNFMRSRDPYEDLTEPFTRKGGPTTPLGYYDAARNQQFRALKRKLNPAQTELAARLSRLDVLGNVWEWCSDWYYPYQSGAAPIFDPQGPQFLSSEYLKNLDAVGQFPSRVVRGGAWNSELVDITAQARGKFAPEQSSFSIGFRMVFESTP